MKNLLWIPENTSNRTAFITKDIDRWPDTEYGYENGILNCRPFQTWKSDNSYLESENPNCCTMYKIIQIPESITKEMLEGEISQKVKEEVGYNNYMALRAIKAKYIDVIRSVIATYEN